MGNPIQVAVVAAVFALGLGTPSAAQLTISPTLEPNRIDENFRQPLEAEAAPAAPLQERQTAQPRPQNAESVSFSLREVRISGATVFDDAELLDAWPHRPSERVSLADIYDLAAIITRAYADAGYALSFAVVPEQEIDDGVVNLRVIEGFAESVVLAGSAVDGGNLGAARGAIERYVSKITGSRPLRNADLERYLLLINDIPGITARATLSPSDSTVGGSVLTLEIDRDPVEAELGYTSFLPKELDRHVAAASVQANGLLSGTDALRLSLLRSIASDAYLSAGGEASTAIGMDGVRVSLGGNYARTRPVTAQLQALDYEGEAASVRLGATYPLIRSRAKNLLLSLSAEMDNSDIQVLDTSFQRDRLRTIEAALSYDFASDDQSVTLVRGGLARGLDVFGARGNSRANGEPAYTLVTVDAQRTQPLATLGNGRLSLFANASAQTSLDEPLLSGAECGYGGRQYGRRFDAGALTGDRCLLANTELRYSTPLSAFFSSQTGVVQFYGFADGGLVGQRGRLEPGEIRDQSGASAGLGLRFSRGDFLNGTLEASHRLKDPTGIAGDDGNFRLTGSLIISI